MKLPKIYAIINYEDTTDPVEYAQYLLESGIRLIQLRDKSDDISDFLKLTAKEIVHIKKRFFPHAKIIINDHIDLCRDSEADGVHLGQSDTSPTTARSTLGEDAIIGLSTHVPEHIIQAPLTALSYVACGPVFTSKTKSGHAMELGLKGVEKMKSLTSLPLVAIGGITLEKAETVIQSGANSVAIIRDLAEKRKFEQLNAEKKNTQQGDEEETLKAKLLKYKLAEV